MWLGIVKLVLAVIGSVADYLGNKKLLDVGQALAISEGLRATIDNMEKANAVRANIHAHPDSAFADRVRRKYERPDNE